MSPTENGAAARRTLIEGLRSPLVHIVVMGCGRVGSSVARRLDSLGHSIAVIDQAAESFRRLGPDFRGAQVPGVGFDRRTLVKAGIERASAFAAVSSGDNSNIISARVAREIFGVGHVVARIYDPRRAEVYERLGIPTVATVPWTTDRLIRELLADKTEELWRDPTGQIAFRRLRYADQWVGRRLEEFQEATGARVTYLVRFGKAMLPTRQTVIQSGDGVYVMTTDDLADTAVSVASAAPEEKA